MWTLLRTFLLVGLGYLLGVVPSFKSELFQFDALGSSSVHPSIWLAVGLLVLLFSFYVITYPLYLVSKAEKKATERYMTNTKVGKSDYHTRRGSF
jgi:hypothetical protein